MRHLRIVRGNPTDGEVAALVAALAVVQRRQSAAAAAAESEQDSATSAWSDHAAGLRRSVHPGPDVWRRSAWPI